MSYFKVYMFVLFVNVRVNEVLVLFVPLFTKHKVPLHLWSVCSP